MDFEEQVVEWGRRMLHWHSNTLLSIRDTTQKEPPAKREAARRLVNLRMVQPDLFGKL